MKTMLAPASTIARHISAPRPPVASTISEGLMKASVHVPPVAITVLPYKEKSSEVGIRVVAMMSCQISLFDCLLHTLTNAFDSSASTSGLRATHNC